MNSIQSLMIDLDSSYNGFDGNGPDSTKVDELFSLEIKTDKGTESSEVNGAPTVTQTATGGKAYLKIFGNVSDITLEVTANSGLGEGNSVVFNLYAIGATGDRSGTPIATATIDAEDVAASFNKFEGAPAITSDTVYWVEITSITSSQGVVMINHSTGTCTGGSSIPDDMKLSLTFTAQPTPAS